MVKVLALAALVALAGCQTPSGDFCDISRPLRLSAATVDAMTDQEVAVALAFNKRGEALCGWRP